MAHVDLYTKTNPDGTVYHFRDDRLPGGDSCMFPVGYIYMSVDSTDPGTIFGGTWERIQDAFLLAAGTNHSAGSTGGAETVTLTANEIPAHTHGSKSLTGYTHFRRFGTTAAGTDIGGVNSTSGILSKTSPAWPGNHGNINATSTQFSNPTVDRITVDATHEHTSVGGGGAHNNMPPYLAVYMWKRTA